MFHVCDLKSSFLNPFFFLHNYFAIWLQEFLCFFTNLHPIIWGTMHQLFKVPYCAETVQYKYNLLSQLTVLCCSKQCKFDDFCGWLISIYHFYLTALWVLNKAENSFSDIAVKISCMLRKRLD